MFLATVVGCLDYRTQFWKGVIKGLFKQSLVSIGPVVSEMKILIISSPFLFLVTSTMLVGGRDSRTQFWKGSTHGPFHQIWS